VIASIPARCALAGVLLGLAAFAADSFEGATGVLMQLVAGGGFAWGCAGLAAGYVVRDRRAAMMGAVTLLAVATVVYYGVIAATGVRPRDPPGSTTAGRPGRARRLHAPGGRRRHPAAHAGRTAAGRRCGRCPGGA